MADRCFFLVVLYELSAFRTKIGQEFGGRHSSGRRFLLTPDLNVSRRGEKLGMDHSTSFIKCARCVSQCSLSVVLMPQNFNLSRTIELSRAMVVCCVLCVVWVLWGISTSGKDG